MAQALDKIFAIKAINFTTQQVVIGQARFSLSDAIAILETANDTEDAWFYEVVRVKN